MNKKGDGHCKLLWRGVKLLHVHLDVQPGHT